MLERQKPSGWLKDKTFSMVAFSVDFKGFIGVLYMKKTVFWGFIFSKNLSFWGICLFQLSFSG
jgi:hypothetical protein